MKIACLQMASEYDMLYSEVNMNNSEARLERENIWLENELRPPGLLEAFRDSTWSWASLAREMVYSRTAVITAIRGDPRSQGRYYPGNKRSKPPEPLSRGSATLVYRANYVLRNGFGDKSWPPPGNGLTAELRSQGGIASLKSTNYTGFGLAGFRSDLGCIRFRSRWEANVARILNLLKEQGVITSWQFEPCLFEFKDGSKYLPDFEVLYPDGSIKWWEIKGWWQSSARKKVVEFCRQFPEEHLIVPDYKWLTKQYKHLISTWDDSGVTVR